MATTFDDSDAITFTAGIGLVLLILIIISACAVPCCIVGLIVWLVNKHKNETQKNATPPQNPAASVYPISQAPSPPQQIGDSTYQATPAYTAPSPTIVPDSGIYPSAGSDY